MASSKKPQINWKDPLGKTLQEILKNAIRKGSARKDTQVNRVIDKVIEVNGKKVGNAATKAKNTQMGLRRELYLAEQELKRRASNAKIIKSQGRTVGAGQMSEAVGRKGTKIVRGKEVPVSKAKAEEIITQGQRATSQRAKGNAARAAEQAALREKVKAAKTAEQRYAAREALKKHKDKYGDFGR